MSKLRKLLGIGQTVVPPPAGTLEVASYVGECETEPEMSIALSKETHNTAAGGIELSRRFEERLKNSYKQAYSFAYRLTGNATDAEDLVQETYLRAFRFFHRYDDALPFANWLCRIMSNANVDSIRKKSRLKTSSIDQQVYAGAPVLEIPDKESMPDRRLLNQSLNEHLQQGLASITPEFRTAVLLADVEGLEYEEIAEVMSTSIGTVRSRIHRGRKQLRRFLVKRSPDFARMSDEL
jgi:RNA polymerase sigma-70 factor (ECF subfamily)